jgi:hypothetical protein
MNDFAKLLMFVMGIGLALVAIQGAVRGWLPTGPQGLQQGKGVRKDQHPLIFWFFFLLYLGLGLYVAGYALDLVPG